MLKKGHCYVNVQGENALEYARFYDFSKSNEEPELLREELLQEHLRETEREESLKIANKNFSLMSETQC